MTARRTKDTGYSKELEALVGRLWNKGFSDEANAFRSTEFRWLAKYCRERYCGPGTPCEIAPGEKFDLDAQASELQRCFRFVGAPWYSQPFPQAGSAAK